MTSKDTINLSITIGLLSLASYFVWNGFSGTSDDTGDETKTEWYCTACNKPFVLNGAEQAKSMRLVERPNTEQKSSSDGPSARGRDDIRTFNIAKCPFCGQWRGEAARTCNECGEIFLARTKEGETAICPKCNWDPHTGHIAHGERLTTGKDR